MNLEKFLVRVWRHVRLTETQPTDKAEGPVEPTSIGEALDLVDNIGRRSMKDWRDQVGEVRAFVQGLHDPNDNPLSPERINHFLDILNRVYNGLDEATRSLTRTKEELETRSAYTDLQNKLLDGWPKSAVSERLFYLGTGLIGGGGVAAALLGTAASLVYAFLWTVGLISLGLSFIGLWRYDKKRESYFSETLKRVR